MESTQEILVVFLASALAVFLFLGIILMIICIKIANKVKHITEKAEHFSEKAEDIAEFLSKSAVPLAVAKFVAVVSDYSKSRNSKKSRKG